MSSTSQPKGRFYTRVNEQDFLGITIRPGKTDPTAEVMLCSLDVEMETTGKPLDD